MMVQRYKKIPQFPAGFFVEMNRCALFLHNLDGGDSSIVGDTYHIDARSKLAEVEFSALGGDFGGHHQFAESVEHGDVGVDSVAFNGHIASGRVRIDVGFEAVVVDTIGVVELNSFAPFGEVILGADSLNGHAGVGTLFEAFNGEGGGGDGGVDHNFTSNGNLNIVVGGVASPSHNIVVHGHVGRGSARSFDIIKDADIIHENIVTIMTSS